MLPPLPRCSRRAQTSLKLTRPYQPSPKWVSGRPAHRPFRGLLSVHSRCGLHTRTVTYVTVIRGLQTFRHLHACPGCFRLELLAGWDFHPLESAAFARRTPLADDDHVLRKGEWERQLAGLYEETVTRHADDARSEMGQYRRVMSEHKRRSRSRNSVLEAEPRCIYCAGAPETREHMPPVSMFRGRYRLSGMEYACCERCNQGTKAADAVAGFLSYIGRPGYEKSWHTDEMMRVLKAVNHLVPGFSAELRGERPQIRWIYGPNGLLRQGVSANGDGPILTKHMDIFSAKLGMALYREHVGQALPLDGRVFTRWFLNSGITDDQVRTMISIMPIAGSLRMGRQHSIEQFGYRYNCDEKSIIAAVAGFHSNLHVLAVATANPDTFGPSFAQQPVLKMGGRPWFHSSAPGDFHGTQNRETRHPPAAS